MTDRDHYTRPNNKVTFNHNSSLSHFLSSHIISSTMKLLLPLTVYLLAAVATTNQNPRPLEYNDIFSFLETTQRHNTPRPPKPHNAAFTGYTPTSSPSTPQIHLNPTTQPERPSAPGKPPTPSPYLSTKIDHVRNKTRT